MPDDPIANTRLHRNPGTLLAGQIEALAGGRVKVFLHRQRPWASITFSGTRYGFSIKWVDTVAVDEIKHLATTLPKHVFAIPGYFVADMVVTEQAECHLLAEALTIVDPA